MLAWAICLISSFLCYANPLVPSARHSSPPFDTNLLRKWFVPNYFTQGERRRVYRGMSKIPRPIELISDQSMRYVQAQTPYILDTTQADNQVYTHYLPERCTKLVKFLEQNTLQETLSYVTEDPDFDSDLFVFNPQKPEKILAYSRHPEFSGISAHALQKKVLSGNTTDIFTKLISTAHKGVDFASYTLIIDKEQPHPFFVACSREVNIGGHALVVGVAINVPRVNLSFIIPQRTHLMARRIKKEGLERALEFINNDPDKEGYFFVMQTTTPYRLVAHGGNPKLILQDGATWTKLISANCPVGLCPGEALKNQFADIALRGGGFSSYVWRLNETSPLYFKLIYIEPFRYKQEEYLVAGSYAPTGVPTGLEQTILKKFERVQDLIATAGLENASIIMRKESSRELFSFIREAQFPYRSTISEQRPLDGLTGFETQKKLRNQHDNFDALQTIKNVAWFSKKFGGFYAYSWRDTAQDAIGLRLTYVKHTTHDNKPYYIGVGYVFP